MTKTQEQIIREQLERYGKVSNKKAILGGIWRLGAIICELRKSGLNIDGAYEVKQGKKTKNYVYSLSRANKWKASALGGSSIVK